jgi:DnaK suppressor protein
MPINASGLTEAQSLELKKILDERLASVNSEIRELESALTEEENEDKGAPDEVDRSSFEEEMQRMQLVLDGKKQLQYEISEALKRMNDGNYGVCEETEEPIGYNRLRAQPWTRLSLEAQQELEQRRKNRPMAAAGGGYSSAYDGEESGDEG